MFEPRVHATLAYPRKAEHGPTRRCPLLIFLCKGMNQRAVTSMADVEVSDSSNGVRVVICVAPQSVMHAWTGNRVRLRFSERLVVVVWVGERDRRDEI